MLSVLLCKSYLPTYDAPGVQSGHSKGSFAPTDSVLNKTLKIFSETMRPGWGPVYHITFDTFKKLCFGSCYKGTILQRNYRKICHFYGKFKT